MTLRKLLTYDKRKIESNDTMFFTIDKLFFVLDCKSRGEIIRFDGVWFGGFIDAVAQNGDAEDVIDWKTGRFSRDWVFSVERQVQLYTHLMRLANRVVDAAKIVYVEQKNKVHLVDVSIETCERVYNEMRETYKKILAIGEEIENFKKIDSVAECNKCYYDFICNI